MHGRANVGTVSFLWEQAVGFAGADDQVDLALPERAKLPDQIGVAGDEVVVCKVFELERAIVQLNPRPAVDEQRFQASPRDVAMAPEKQGAHRVARFVGILPRVLIERAVVELIVAGDAVLRDQQRPPGVVDDRLGDLDVRSARQNPLPPADAHLALPLKEVEIDRSGRRRRGTGSGRRGHSRLPGRLDFRFHPRARCARCRGARRRGEDHRHERLRMLNLADEGRPGRVEVPVLIELSDARPGWIAHDVLRIDLEQVIPVLKAQLDFPAIRIRKIELDDHRPRRR